MHGRDVAVDVEVIVVVVTADPSSAELFTGVPPELGGPGRFIAVASQTQIV